MGGARLLHLVQIGSRICRCQFRQDKALALLLGDELPAAQTARDFLAQFHAEDLPLLQGGQIERAYRVGAAAELGQGQCRTRARYAMPPASEDGNAGCRRHGDCLRQTGGQAGLMMAIAAISRCWRYGPSRT
jgi:hypothetical protein